MPAVKQIVGAEQQTANKRMTQALLDNRLKDARKEIKENYANPNYEPITGVPLISYLIDSGVQSKVIEWLLENDIVLFKKDRYGKYPINHAFKKWGWEGEASHKIAKRMFEMVRADKNEGFRLDIVTTMPNFAYTVKLREGNKVSNLLQECMERSEKAAMAYLDTHTGNLPSSDRRASLREAVARKWGWDSNAHAAS